MTKKEAKTELTKLINNLRVYLEVETFDANCYNDISDGWGLITHCTRARNCYQKICNIQSAFNLPNPRELTHIIRYYETEIRQIKRLNANKGE